MKRILTDIQVILIPLLLVFGVLNCASSNPYKLSEALPKYAKYEGKSIDPLIDNPINKPETGVQKYDDFFIRAKTLIIKVHLANKIFKAKDSEDIPGKAELLMDFATEIPSLVKDIAMITKDGKDLSSSVQSDFMGPNIFKLPSVIGELAVTTKELAEAGIVIPKLIAGFSSSDTDGDKLAQADDPNSSQVTMANESNLANSSTSNNSSSPTQPMVNFKSNSIIPVFSSSEATKTRLLKRKINLVNFQNFLEQKKGI
jgi:hypothetical protein